MTMPKRTSDYRESLLRDLQDDKEAAHYLNAAIEDSPGMLLVAQRDVAAANQESSSVELFQIDAKEI